MIWSPNNSSLVETTSFMKICFHFPLSLKMPGQIPIFLPFPVPKTTPKKSLLSLQETLPLKSPTLP